MWVPDPQGVISVYVPWWMRNSRARFSDLLQGVCGVAYRRCAICFEREKEDKQRCGNGMKIVIYMYGSLPLIVCMCVCCVLSKGHGFLHTVQATRSSFPPSSMLCESLSPFCQPFLNFPFLPFPSSDPLPLLRFPSSFLISFPPGVFSRTSRRLPDSIPSAC